MSNRSAFQASFDPGAVEDLRRRLAGTRWPDEQTVDGWEQGVPLDYARELSDYWQTAYDWERVPRILNTWPQEIVTLETGGDSYAVHCIHRRSPNERAKPLLITHGWPGSVLEFWKVIDALADPEGNQKGNHEGNREGNGSDAFHVIVPSLPGYGFSSQPGQAGTTVERIADLWNALMAPLGYQQYYAQGGDWGSVITCAIGQRHADRCQGIHLNMVVAPPDPDTLAAPSDLENSALAAMQRYASDDSGYSKIQSTRPQTIGYGLSDSPVAQMSWIIDKFWSWTDCEREGKRHPENAISRDEMLDMASLYWLTNSGASSARLYWESFNKPNLEPVTIPVGGSVFPNDIFLSSERWARKRFPALCYWREMDRGGHFAALEQPALFIEELRRCFRTMA